HPSSVATASPIDASVLGTDAATTEARAPTSAAQASTTASDARRLRPRAWAAVNSVKPSAGGERAPAARRWSRRVDARDGRPSTVIPADYHRPAGRVGAVGRLRRPVIHLRYHAARAWILAAASPAATLRATHASRPRSASSNALSARSLPCPTRPPPC